MSRWMLGEWRAAVELAQLHADPVYQGIGVPRGAGRLVVVVPGLFANDVYLAPFRTWLARIGYRPVSSTLSINAGCPERLRHDVEEALAQRRAAGERVALIGHSRGGILARAIAARLGGEVSHLILLGSPVTAATRAATGTEPGDPPARRGVVEASAYARRVLDPECDFPACGCAFVEDVSRPLDGSTRVLSIRTAEDAVVNPEACVVPDAVNVEVGGTHSGLVYNRRAYVEIANALAA